MIECRLVRQLRILHTGAGGVIVEHEQIRYVLQTRRVADVFGKFPAPGPWQTCPEVDFNHLTLAEKAEIIDAEERRR